MSLYLYDGATPWDADRLRLVKSRGGIAVSVYIVGSPGGMRHATAGDVALARSMGFGVVPNWERAADFFRTASFADCKNAGAETLAACRQLGFPDDGSVGVPFSFDYQVPASGYGRARDQLLYCGDGMGGHYVPLGYAQIDLINYFAARGLPGPHWLMGSTWRASSAFTTAEVGSRNVAMVQSHDAAGRWLNSLIRGTDINTITQPDRLLAWWPDGSPYGDPMNPADVWNYSQTIWNKSKPAAWSVLSSIHQTVHNIASTVNGVASGVADTVTRLAAVQSTLAAVQADVAAIKAQPATVQINPADVPVTGTVHIGGTQ